MDDIYIIWFLLFVAVFLPLIARRKRLAAIRHILNKKMRKEEADDMTELAKRFIMRQVWRTAEAECRWLYAKRISDI